MSDIFSVTLQDVYLPEGNLKINNVSLRKFQEELYYALDNSNEICLQAPTGSGKTFSILVMLAKLALKALPLPIVGIYPSRVLVYDQGKSVRKILVEKAGFKDDGSGRLSGKIEVEGKSREINVTLVELTSETRKDVIQTLEDYTPTTKNYLILLTVPEYPFMYISHLKAESYFGSVIEYVMKGVIDKSPPESVVKNIFNRFSKYFNGYFFIDEFHLYSGLARASLFTLKRMIDDFTSSNPPALKPKFVFSSATPTEIQCKKVITATSSDSGMRIRKKTNLVFHMAVKEPQQRLVEYVAGAKFDRRTMIILDRVYYIAELCKSLPAGLLWGLDISYGLCNKLSKVGDENVIVGNNAISFGVDVPNLDLGFIHSHDAETAIQRIGRFGRHGEGEAEVHVFLEAKKKVVDTLKQISEQKKEIRFEEYVKLIESIYQRRVDDKLDKIEFSLKRSEILFNAYLILNGISNGDMYFQNGKFYLSNGQEVKPLKLNLNLRPSSEDYYKVFAFRAGGLQGKWCDGGSDELFTMLRNFEYNVEGKCFTKEPLKQNPEVLLTGMPSEEFESYDKFHRETNPKIIVNRGEGTTSLRYISGIQDSYVITLTKMPEWKNFDEMARLISTYESALPACLDNHFDSNKRRCGKIDALLLFI